MNCEYGCGQEAVHQFKNGKWCCNKSSNSCPGFREKTSVSHKKRLEDPIERQKLRTYIKQAWKDPDNKLNSKEYRNKLSKAKKENCNIELKRKAARSLWDNTNWKSKVNKKSFDRIIRDYPFLINELRWNNNKIEAKCKNDKCRKWFTPTNNQIWNRLGALGKCGGESHFYCSDECKKQCPIFGIRSDSKINPNLATSNDLKDWREEVLKRANYKCEYCGDDANHAHHSRPQKLEPFFSLDPDFGIACCTKCHYKKGHKDECSTGQLAYKVC